MRSEKRKAYEREYKRRKRADPAWRAKRNERDRQRMANTDVRAKKNARERARLAGDDAYRKRQNHLRYERRKKEQLEDAWREMFRKFQKDYYARHKDDGEWRHRRDLHRVKSFYGVTDSELAEALALARAAKRKMRG